MSNNENLVSSTVSTGGGAFNASLLQGGTLAKIVIGFVVAVVVVVGAATAGTVVVVRAQPSPPKTNPFSSTTFKNQPITFNPTLNDIAIERDNVKDANLIKLDSVDNPDNGNIVYSQVNKSVTYTPNAGWIGSEVFSYTISNDKRSAEGTINITTINRAPIASDDNFDVSKNAENILNVLENDHDEDGDKLTISEVTQPKLGKGTVSTDGNTVLFTSGEGQAGADTFMYTITDQNATSVATVRINILNDPPVARDDEYSITMNSGVHVFDILSNDYDDNGDEIKLVSVSAASHGLFRKGESFHNGLSGDDINSVLYSPDFGFSGDDVFDYTITDGFVGPEDEASAVVSVRVVNLPPTAQNITISRTKGPQSIRFNLNDAINDPNPYSTLSVTVESGIGSVELNQAAIATDVEYQGSTKTFSKMSYNSRYLPAFDGEQARSYSERIQYTVSDGEHSAIGFIHVDLQNSAPEAQNDNPSTLDGAQSTHLIDVLENDRDPDGDALEIISIDDTNFNIGSLSVEDGKVRIDLNDGVNNANAVFRYTISDVQNEESRSKTASASVTINVKTNVPSCGSTEIVMDKHTSETVNVLALCSDPLERTLEITSSASGDSNLLSTELAGDSVTIYSQSQGGNTNLNFPVALPGTDIIVFANVHVTVRNKAPILSSQSSYFYRKDGAHTFNLITGDEDPDDDSVSLQGLKTTHGGVLQDGDRAIEFDHSRVEIVNNYQVTVYPKGESPVHTIKFSFVVTDSDNNEPKTAEEVATVEILSDRPSASAIVRNYKAGEATSFSIVDFVRDEDGDRISLVSVSNASPYSIEVEHSGMDITFTPKTGAGVDICQEYTFNYIISDVNGDASNRVTLKPTDCPTESCDTNVVLVMDTAGSMSPVFEDSIAVAKEFVNQLSSDVHVGVVRYGKRNNGRGNNNNESYNKIMMNPTAGEQAKSDAIDALEEIRQGGASGNAPMGEGLLLAEDAVFNTFGSQASNIVYLVFNDGLQNSNKNSAGANGVYVYDVANAINERKGRIVTYGIHKGWNGQREARAKCWSFNPDHLVVGDLSASPAQEVERLSSVVCASPSSSYDKCDNPKDL